VLQNVTHQLHIHLVVAAQLDLKANLKSSLPQFSFNRIVPGAFNLGFIGSTCTGSHGLGFRVYALYSLLWFRVYRLGMMV